jgi:glycerol-3-phosphate dehydrogenase
MKDKKLGKKVKQFLEDKKYFQINSSVNDGIVYLDGHLDNWENIVELGHKIGQLKGVEEVVNDVLSNDSVKATTEPKIRLSKKFYDPILPKKADVVIVGGGVVGCFIARELSRYKLDVVLLEKESDVCGGATKANSAQIHTGVGESFGTLKRKLCVKSWPLFDKISDELDVPYDKTGLLIVITNDSLSKNIPGPFRHFLCKYLVPLPIWITAKMAKDKPKIVRKGKLLKMEPYLSEKALVGVLMPNYGIIDPFRLTFSLAENAIQNGVKIFIDTEVTNIKVENKKISGVVTTRGTIDTDFIVNAAGVYADRIAEMAGTREFTIHPRKGGTVLFDKKTDKYATHQLNEFKLPRNEHTKGGGVLKTADGNINFGPSAFEVPDKEDTSISKEDLDNILEKYATVFSYFPKKSVITYFSGLRACTYKEDFIIKPSKNVKGLIHAAGIQSPGLTCSPTIATMILEILEKEGLPMEEKEAFNPISKRAVVFRELTLEGKKNVVAEDKLYGNVVCRCEHVTEGEIVKAIHSSIPALTVDAVKRRTRAGMGRCQSGFCGHLVAKILARELGVPMEEITKNGGDSRLFIGKTKEFLAED